MKEDKEHSEKIRRKKEKEGKKGTQKLGSLL